MKAPALVTEELALEQRIGQRAAVLGDEALVLARPGVVDRAGHQVLAGARLAEEQHRRVGLGDLLHHLEDPSHRRAGADDLVEGVLPLDLLAQVDVLGAKPLVGLGQSRRQLHVLGGQPVGLQCPLDVDSQLVRLPGLLDVAIDAPVVDGAHDRVDVRVAGEHHPHRLRLALDHLLEELDPAHRGHHLVDDHQRDLLALEDLHAVVAVGRREDLVVLAQRQLEGLQDRLLVVDDEDAVGMRAGLTPRPLDDAGAVFQCVDHLFLLTYSRSPRSAVGPTWVQHTRPFPNPAKAEEAG